MDDESKDSLDSLFDAITVDRKGRRPVSRPSFADPPRIDRSTAELFSKFGISSAEEYYIRSGDKISAIKIFRGRTDASLKEAKDVIVEHERRLGGPFYSTKSTSFDPDRFTMPPPPPPPPPSSPPRPEPTSTRSYEQPAVTNTRQETATLALNTAKACIVFRAVYSDEVRQNIKETIPSKHRLWNDRDRVWEFNPCVLKELKALLSILYADVQVVGVPKALPATKFDKLISKLDKDDKAKIYRILASKYHPDVQGTGSNEVMTLLNEVFKQ